MDSYPASIARLFLPLLVNDQPAVRHQACLIMLGTYGGSALTELRRLLDDPDVEVRQTARLALLAVAEVSDMGVRPHPFRGMMVACLGRLQVFVGNRELRQSDWAQADGGRAGWQKVQGMLAYLVHCGARGASRTALGAAVWGGSFSRASLARTLSVLQQALGGDDSSAPGERALVIESDYCRLDPTAYATDVQLFEQAYTMAALLEQESGLAEAAPMYARAVQLYGGPYMAGVANAESWSRRRRDDLMGSFMIASERMAEHAYISGKYRQCEDICTQALDADPTADDVLCWLLRALAQAGRYGELERAYRAYLHALEVNQAGDGASDQAAPTYRELTVGRTR
jgi:DNA-binding SARP family transcriptional activator